MLVDVTQVSTIQHHTLKVTFADGTSGIVKFEESFFRGVFKPLLNSEAFAKVTVSDGAVTWPNDLDLAPDQMYDQIKKNQGLYVLA